MIYKAYWYQNGTRNADPYKGTNKAQLTRYTREVAIGNTPKGCTCTWHEEDEHGRTVAAGGMFKNGKRWRAHEDELKLF